MKTAGRAGGRTRRSGVQAAAGIRTRSGPSCTARSSAWSGSAAQGRRVAEIGRAFGMALLAWSQHLDPDVAERRRPQAVSKQELFSPSDVATVHYKLAPAQRGAGRRGRAGR